MSQQFIRVPPDSTGKKISHVAEIDVILVGDVRNQVKYGDTVTGLTSLFSGSVAGVHLEGINTEISIVIGDYSNADQPTVGETLAIKSVGIGTVMSVLLPNYIPRSVIASGDNPYRIAKVDEYGQVNVSIGGGDSFNRQLVSSPHTVRNYQFNLSQSDFFCDLMAVGGTKTHRPEYSGMVLSTTADSGSLSCTTSHIYHYYTPGLSQQVLMTVALSDTGKVNNLRQWGYMDDQDGVFFELTGTVLNIVLRRSVNGTVEELRIPQSDWNANRVNGEGGTFNINNFYLDITKDNIYWIDFQWLGAGRIRYGVFVDGVRVTCHDMSNTNVYSRPYMRSGSLPIRVRSENTGVTAGTSEITAFCMTVLTGGDLLPVLRTFGRIHAGLEQVSSDTQRFVVSSMRMKQLFKGRPNHSIGLPVIFSLYAKDNPIVFEIVKNGTLTGVPTETPWSRNPTDDSAVEFDYAYDSITGGNVIISRIVAPGQIGDIDMTGQFGLTKELLFRHANNTEYDTYAFCVRTLYPNVTADAWIALEWNELQIN